MSSPNDNSTTTTTSTSTTTTNDSNDTSTSSISTISTLASDTTNDNNKHQQQQYMYSDDQFMTQMQLYEQYKQFNESLTSQEMSEQRVTELYALRDELRLTSDIYERCYVRCIDERHRGGGGAHHHSLNLRLYLSEKLHSSDSKNENNDDYVLSMSDRDCVKNCVREQYELMNRTRQHFLDRFIHGKNTSSGGGGSGDVSSISDEYVTCAHQVYQYVHSTPKSLSKQSSKSSPSSPSTQPNNSRFSRFGGTSGLLMGSGGSGDSADSADNATPTTALGLLVAPPAPKQT